FNNIIPLHIYYPFTRPQLGPCLLPYTTLFRSRLESGAVVVKREWHPLEEIVGAALTRLDHSLEGRAITTDIPDDLPLVSVDDVRSEEHTSELQSRENIVCRLLLEKKI